MNSSSNSRPAPVRWKTAPIASNGPRTGGIVALHRNSKKVAWREYVAQAIRQLEEHLVVGAEETMVWWVFAPNRVIGLHDELPILRDEYIAFFRESAARYRCSTPIEVKATGDGSAIAKYIETHKNDINLVAFAGQFTDAEHPWSSRSLPTSTTVSNRGSSASDIIAQHTAYGNLDENMLGAELVDHVRSGGPGDCDLVQAVLDELGVSDRDDASEAFMASIPDVDLAKSDSLLVKMVTEERGRRLLDRMYDELTQGIITDGEQRQASRILQVKGWLIEPSAFAEAALDRKTKIIPFRPMGPTVLNDAPILSARREIDGGISVRLPVRVFGTDEFRNLLQ